MGKGIDRVRKQSIAGVILAGGKSSRMGQPKELLAWQGKPLIQYLQEEMAAVALPCLIVSNTPEALEQEVGAGPGREVEVTRDLVPSSGPISGIVSAFRVRREDALLVLSCDLPFADRKQLRRLIDFAGEANDWDAVVVKEGERLHPLFALYHRRSQPLWEEALRRKQYRLMEVLRGLQVAETPPGLFDPWAAFNANTPEEYRAALQEKQKRETGQS
ncbi:molybdenum cofactor guanylyltransferase [Brevibacillus borstelensis]|uniref:molybdenum cofactor guanylyltransferase n=1 Tax=Brevibacillus borstelensis TaxID=45462 RepID=UPI0030C5C4B9